MRGFRHIVAVAVALVIGLSGLAMTSCAFPPPAGCYDSTFDEAYDIWFNGQIDTLDNAKLSLTTEGTCSNQAIPMTVVVAANEDDALTKCVALDADTLAATNMRESGYSEMPADAYYCYKTGL